MNESLKERVRRFLQAHRHRKIWEKLVGSLAVVVVFVTSYLLILPAITMEKTTYCGNARHTHTASCYEPSEEILDEDDISGSTGSASAGISVPSWTDSRDKGNHNGALGSFGWTGGFGTFCEADPADGVSIVYMHNMIPNNELYYHHRVRTAAYALID